VKDIFSTLIVLLALGAFMALPAAVALGRKQLARPADGVTIPQQRGPEGGEDA
jgi:hypothetical protein